LMTTAMIPHRNMTNLSRPPDTPHASINAGV
jgi:hypothetical protein